MDLSGSQSVWMCIATAMWVVLDISVPFRVLFDMSAVLCLGPTGRVLL